MGIFLYVKIGYNINNLSKVNEVRYGKIYNGIGSGDNQLKMYFI